MIDKFEADLMAFYLDEYFIDSMKTLLPYELILVGKVMHAGTVCISFRWGSRSGSIGCLLEPSF